MRREDLERLGQPYLTHPDGSPNSDLAAALGWRVEPWRELLADVRNDLDEVNLGIGWWRLGPESDGELRRRLVVGDYLISLLEGAEHALIDMALHHLELLDFLEREGDFLRDAVTQLANGQFIAVMPPRRSPLDEVAPALVDGEQDPTRFARRVLTPPSTSGLEPTRFDGGLGVRIGGASGADGDGSGRWGRAARG